MYKPKVIEKKVVFEHPWETIVIEKIKNNSGDTLDYLVSYPNEFVIIVPFFDTETVLVISQYKHGAQEILTGFPAGFIEKSETSIEAAKRELLEETGYKAKRWKKIGYFYENPTRCRSRYYIFFAFDLTIQETFTNKDKNEGQIIQKKLNYTDPLSFQEFIKDVKAGPMLSAILYLITGSYKD